MNIVLVSSSGRCGIYEYSQILMPGFLDAGHRAHYIGVVKHDNHDLAIQLKQIMPDDEIVIIEYEPGIFKLRALVWHMLKLRLRGKRILLSIHEIEPAKYGEWPYLMDRIGQPARFHGVLEIGRLLWATACVAYRYFTLRFFLFLLGTLPERVIVHSRIGAENARIAVADPSKIHYVPHLVKQLEGNRAELRQELDLPQDVFAFIVPGFLFRRKRIVEVVKALPANTELWVVGTPSEYDPGYLEEIEACIVEAGKQTQVRLIQDYPRMEQYLLAADAAVMFYASGYQSGIASLAVGAQKPCIFSDIVAFEDLREAGLIARTQTDLQQKMLEIQEAEVYARLQQKAAAVRAQLSPLKVGEMCLENLEK